MIAIIKWTVVLAVGAMILADGFAHGAPRPTDRQLKRCFVYLPAMHDAKLRRHNRKRFHAQRRRGWPAGYQSTVIVGRCDCCGRLKRIRLYTTWVCKECKKGSAK